MTPPCTQDEALCTSEATGNSLLFEHCEKAESVYTTDNIYATHGLERIYGVVSNPCVAYILSVVYTHKDSTTL